MTNQETFSCMCGVGPEPCPGPDGRPLCATPAAAPSALADRLDARLNKDRRGNPDAELGLRIGPGLYEEVAAAVAALRSAARPADAGEPVAPFRFRRYVGGIEMADGVKITNASTVQEAFAKARAMYGRTPGMDLVLEIAAARPAPTREEIARTICLSYGRDPDELTSWLEMCDENDQPVPTWRVYEEQADEILALFTHAGEEGGRK